MRRVALLLACALALGPPAARADSCDKSCPAGAPRNARGCCLGKPKKAAGAAAARKADLRERQVSLPDLPVQGELTRPAPSALKPDPAARAAVPRRDLGAQVDEAMMGEYERGAKLPDSDPDKPTYLLLLADAQAAQYRQARAGKQAGAPDLLLAAVKSYSALISGAAFARFAKLHEAVGRLALLLEEGGQPERALLLYRRLTKEFPTSPYLAEAYLALGDRAFAEGQLDGAGAFYQKLLARPDAPVYPYVRYMHGWVLFNQDKARDAYASWAEVVTRAAALKQAALVRAAEKDAVRAYAAFGAAAEARKQLAELAPARVGALIEKLADAYLDLGKFPEATQIYRDLLAAEPSSPRQCAWSVAATRTTLATGTRAERVAEIGNLGKRFAQLRDGKRISGKALASCTSEVETMVREAAFAWHNEGTKTLSRDIMAAARTLYELHARLFPTAGKAGQVRYFYAELLWSEALQDKGPNARQRWRAAAEAYGRAIQAPGLAPDKRKEAAYAAVLAWRNVDKEEPPDLDAGKPDPTPRPLPEARVKMIEAIDSYLAIEADSDAALELRFVKARVYWRYHHDAEAVTAFAALVTEHPEHQTAELAARLMFDALNRAGRVSELEAWSRRIEGEARFAALREKLGDVLPAMLYTLARLTAERQEKAGDHAGCGKTYVDIFNRFKNQPQNDEILYNATVCYLRAKLPDAAAASAGLLQKLFPQSPLASRVKELLRR